MTKAIVVGIIAEDDSDVDCLKEFLKKLRPDKSFKVKKQIGRGCAKIPIKCKKWAVVLGNRGCNKLIVMRDSDGANPKVLASNIRKALNPAPVADNVVVIAVQELENWLLADISSIHKKFSITKKIPKEINSPESIANGKEYLYSFVKKNYDKQYLHTRHNQEISKTIDVSKIRNKCPSFTELTKFAAYF